MYVLDCGRLDVDYHHENRNYVRMTLWTTATFPHGVALTTGEPLTMAVIRHLAGNQPYKHAGLRVLAVWNPEIRLWFVYDFDDKMDRPIFSTPRLELHTVGSYSGMKTKFAPHGSPTFVGTIVVESILEFGEKGLTCVTAHPNAPTKTYFTTGPSEHETFDNCRRLLLDGSKMIADRRVKHT